MSQQQPEGCGWLAKPQPGCASPAPSLGLVEASNTVKIGKILVREQ